MTEQHKSAATTSDEARRLENEYFTLVGAFDGMRPGTVIQDSGEPWKKFAIVNGVATWQPISDDAVLAAMQEYVTAHSPDPRRRQAAKTDSAPVTATAAQAPAVAPAAPSSAVVAPSSGDALVKAGAILAEIAKEKRSGALGVGHGRRQAPRRAVQPRRRSGHLARVNRKGDGAHRSRAHREAC